MTSGVFERHEIKYLIDSRQRAAVERALRGHMAPDMYGESSIISLYYDTPDSRMIRRSLEKPEYKEKLRLRSYGTAEADREIFVELKKKVGGIVYKRRISVPEHEATDWLAGKTGLPVNCQIGREIDYVNRFYGGLVPAMYLSYDRIAYFDPEDAGLRVTFDRNIRWRTENLSLTKAPAGEMLIRPDISLLEIKTARAVPMWLVKALEENKIRQTSFSKYGAAYTANTFREKENKGGFLSA